MRVAFYKAIRPGISALFSIVVRCWTRSPYSHCEVVFSDGMAASSSFLDGGVRFKDGINFDSGHWDVIEVAGDEKAARAWFMANLGRKYDTLGLFGFIIRPLEGDRRRFFCSEAIMSALGYSEAWRFDPATAHAALSRANAP